MVSARSSILTLRAHAGPALESVANLAHGTEAFGRLVGLLKNLRRLENIHNSQLDRRAVSRHLPGRLRCSESFLDKGVPVRLFDRNRAMRRGSVIFIDDLGEVVVPFRPQLVKIPYGQRTRSV